MEKFGRIERKDAPSEREQLVRFLRDQANWTKARWAEIEDAAHRLHDIEENLPPAERTPHTTAGLPALH